MIRKILSYFHSRKTKPNRHATFQDISNLVDILTAETKPQYITINVILSISSTLAGGL